MGRPVGIPKSPASGRKKGTVLHPLIAKRVVDHIQASRLVTRLTKHAMGELEKPMDPSQVQAAKILLDKILSNAPTRTELSGADGGDIPVAIRVVFGAS